MARQNCVYVLVFFFILSHKLSSHESHHHVHERQAIDKHGPHQTHPLLISLAITWRTC